MKRIAGAISSLFFAMLLVAAPALASPVSYVAELNTSNRNPVTNVLLLEEDEAGTVHAKVYGSALPGSGQVVIGHNPAFTPRRTLIIGLTDGLSPEGTPKTQINLFVNTAFAAAINGVKWSLALPGSSHSGTIASLIAATGGGATELGWFTGDFFKQIAAPAVFATGADFVVGEFSDFTPIGRAATIPVPGLAAGAMAALMLLLAGLAAFRLRRSGCGGRATRAVGAVRCIVRRAGGRRLSAWSGRSNERRAADARRDAAVLNRGLESLPDPERS